MASYFWSSTSSTDPTLGANWTKSDGTTGTAPTTADDAFIQAIPGSALANIAAADMHTVVLNSLTISQSYTGTIGGAGTGGYWQIAATTWTIGTIAGGINPGGSGRIKIDFGTNQFTGTVISTAGASTDTNQEPVRIKGTHASNKLSVLSGTVGVATNQPGETSTLSEIDVVGNTATGTSPTCNLSSGVTWTTAYCAGGGTLATNSGGTTLDCAGGTVTCNGTALVTTVTNSGTIYFNVTPASGSCITTLNNLNGGTVDFSGGPAARTVGTYKPYASSSIRLNAANPAHVTFTTVSPQNLSTLTYA
jgi:hypothetical protein